MRWLLVGGLVLAVGGAPWFLAVWRRPFVLLLATFVLQPPAEFQDRSFFGVTEVLAARRRLDAVLMNGTTVHGTQWTDPAEARHPDDLLRAATARSARPSRSSTARPRPAARRSRVAIVGLGAGTLAAYDDSRAWP